MKKTYSPLKSIRKRCIDCAETWAEVKICNADKDNGSIEKCPLFPFRLGKTVKGMSRIKAIYKYCLWCTQSKDKRGIEEKCSGDIEKYECPLFPYRFGKNPTCSGRKGNIEELKKYQAQKKLSQVSKL